MSDANAGIETTSKKKRGCGFWLLCGIGLFALVPLGRFIIPPQEVTLEQRYAKAEAEIAKEKAERAAAPKVTAVELYRAYQANEARAQRDYGDRLLEVSGTIDSISLGLGDIPFLELVTDNQFMTAHVELTDEGRKMSADLSKGQKVTLLCRAVSEMAGRPMLKDCDILAE